MIKYITVEEAIELTNVDYEIGDWFVIENIQYFVVEERIE